MDKETLLQELSAKIDSGEISREDITSVLGLSAAFPVGQAGKNTKEETSRHLSITKIFYMLGALIAIIGIVVFVGQIWEDIGSFGKISVTLGLGILLAAIGSVLLKKKPEDYIGPIFHTIGGVLIPSGVLVALYETGIKFESVWSVTASFGAVFVFYFLLTLVHKHPILTFFSIANGTAFIYSLVEAMLGDVFYNRYEDLYAYLTMAVGASYLFFANSFRDGWNRKLVVILRFCGTAGFLGAAFSQVFDSGLWQILYFIVVFAGVFLSVRMSSKSVLAVSTLFLIAHVSYITGKYFADSIGWPISLVILGFLFIAMGYSSIRIGQKYIKS